jgi:hypothetical protein
MASPLLKGIIPPETNLQNGSEIAGPLSWFKLTGDNHLSGNGDGEYDLDGVSLK